MFGAHGASTGPCWLKMVTVDSPDLPLPSAGQGVALRTGPGRPRASNMVRQCWIGHLRRLTRFVRGPGENWLGWCRSGLGGSVANRVLCIHPTCAVRKFKSQLPILVTPGSRDRTGLGTPRRGVGRPHGACRKTHTGRFEPPQAASEHPPPPHLCRGLRKKLCVAPLGSIEQFPQGKPTGSWRCWQLRCGHVRRASRGADATRCFGPRAQHMPR